MKKIGFIGSGNMAEAIIGGMMKAGYLPEQIVASNRSEDKLLHLKDVYGIQTVESNEEIARLCHIVFLSITPDKYPVVIDEIRDCIQDETIVILIGGGEGIAENEARFGRKVKLVKAMPNTPVLVGEGLTSLSFNSLINEEEQRQLVNLFNSIGKAEVIDEKLMDTASAVGGSSPAFMYMYIEALADAAVLYGMPREKAYNIAAQAALGAAKMVLETGEHPAKLKDEVCSPDGTTIQSVASLEENGFRNAILQAVRANMEKMGH
ncbi:pyrroline-5-carboxylate reductase [Oceanobacillus manasiensis]|uniref:pyrroline-5-carboxylate reductase n=1 Tax=Oceanobacillus manasiensis TaxID=586413 RepID=UPI0005A8B553|nr:pyrroline-5-carboxylate reductase [Oceanobacillus manasiensis]